MVEEAGFFLVRNTGKSKQRSIAGRRKANVRFATLLRVELNSAAALGRIEVLLPENVHEYDTGMCDVWVAFHRLRPRPGLAILASVLSHRRTENMEGVSLGCVTLWGADQIDLA